MYSVVNGLPLVFSNIICNLRFKFSCTLPLLDLFSFLFDEDDDLKMIGTQLANGSKLLDAPPYLSSESKAGSIKQKHAKAKSTPYKRTDHKSFDGQNKLKRKLFD